MRIPGATFPVPFESSAGTPGTPDVTPIVPPELGPATAGDGALELGPSTVGPAPVAVEPGLLGEPEPRTLVSPEVELPDVVPPGSAVEPGVIPSPIPPTEGEPPVPVEQLNSAQHASASDVRRYV